MTIDDVNAMDRATFGRRIGPTFERAPWVADAAWDRRPFADPGALHAALFDVVASAPAEARLAFLNGHPDLAGKEAEEGSMTRESVGEQASAGLDALTKAEVAEIRSLNAAYREKHGFPFIVAVRRHTKAEILAALHRRVACDTTAEADEAMRQIGFITRGRVDALFA